MYLYVTIAWSCSLYSQEVHLISATFDCSALWMLSGMAD